MNEERSLTAENSPKKPNPEKKVTDSFTKYYEKMYEDLGKKIEKICKEISEIPQRQSTKEDPELELRRIMNETQKHQGEKENPELQNLAKKAWRLMEKQEQTQDIITRLRFPPEQGPES